MKEKQHKDISGLTFNSLTVVEYRGIDKSRSSMWLCRCSCGNEIVTRASSLKNENTKSCGCLRKKMAMIASTTHGLSSGRKRKSRLYRAWTNMKSRCNNDKTPKFKNHGGRGISVCDQWKDYINFHLWATENGYKDNLSLERIDNDKGYSPENCKWATCSEQNINKRTNRIVTVDGISRTVKEWSIVTGAKQPTLHARLNDYGWGDEKTIKTPVRSRRQSL